MRAKRMLRKVLRKQGLQIKREPGLMDFLDVHSITLVLDVGANEGQFGTHLREIGYEGRIISFEPVAEVHARLVANTSRDLKWDARQLALGDKTGKQTINVSKSTLFNSILPITEAATAFEPYAAVARTEIIDVVRLDDIFAEFKSERVFLKVDTQGYEQAVIEGASQSLKAIEGVQLELPIEQLYEGVWRLEEAIASMRAAGFVIAQTKGVNVLPSDQASAVELDCIFRRAEYH